MNPKLCEIPKALKIWDKVKQKHPFILGMTLVLFSLAECDAWSTQLQIVYILIHFTFAGLHIVDKNEYIIQRKCFNMRHKKFET